MPTQLSYQSLIEDFQKREKKAREANLAREREIRKIYGQQIAQYREGGAFREAGLADIERTKTRAVGAGTQQMISSGLYGTTTAAAIPVQAEAQAGYARLKLEDILQERTTEAERTLAGFVERIETPYPDYQMLMEATAAQQQARATPARTTGTYGGGGRGGGGRGVPSRYGPYAGKRSIIAGGGTPYDPNWPR